MELKLQSILFPDKEEYTDNADLFYKGGLGIRDAEEKCFVFSKYSACDFGAYLNAFSMKKWKNMDYQIIFPLSRNTLTTIRNHYQNN